MPWCSAPASASVFSIGAHAVAAVQPSACAQAAKYSDARHGTSLLVIQNGQTVFEHYANGGGPDAAWPIFSGTKNFWGIAALVAISEGRIRLDEPVSDTITEWRGDARKSKITIRQLLTFTDGLEPASFLHRDSIADRNALAIRVSSVASPGVAFTYGPSHPQVFCELLRRKLNGGSTFSYLQQHVLSPLGIGSFEYKQDQKGNPLFATGFHFVGAAMGAPWRNDSVSRIIGRPSNRSERHFAAGLRRNERESQLRPIVLAQPAIRISRRRNRHRKAARSSVATRKLAWRLYFEDCSSRHDRRDRLPLSAAVHHPVHESPDRSAILRRRQIFGRRVSAHSFETLK